MRWSQNWCQKWKNRFPCLRIFGRNLGTKSLRQVCRDVFLHRTTFMSTPGCFSCRGFGVLCGSCRGNSPPMSTQPKRKRSSPKNVKTLWLLRWSESSHTRPVPRNKCQEKHASQQRDDFEPALQEHSAWVGRGQVLQNSTTSSSYRRRTCEPTTGCNVARLQEFPNYNFRQTDKQIDRPT